VRAFKGKENDRVEEDLTVRLGRSVEFHEDESKGLGRKLVTGERVLCRVFGSRETSVLNNRAPFLSNGRIFRL
jgi:hypothetical protein